MAGGLVALVCGGEFIVDGAQGMAKSFRLSERVIGFASGLRPRSASRAKLGREPATLSLGM